MEYMYKDIRDYGIIGNLRSAALVGLEVDNFTTCYDEDRYRDEIQSDVEHYGNPGAPSQICEHLRRHRTKGTSLAQI